MRKIVVTKNDKVRAFALFYFSNFVNIEDITPKVMSDNILTILDIIKNQQLTDDELSLLKTLKNNFVLGLDLSKSIEDGISEDTELKEFYQDKINAILYDTLNIANILSRN